MGGSGVDALSNVPLVIREEIVPVLRVQDASLATAWYRRLGFVKEWEHQFEPGFPWFVALTRGDVRLYLSEHEGDAQPGACVHLFIADIETIAEEFAVAIDEQGLAGRECGLLDPDGNQIRVATPRT